MPLSPRQRRLLRISLALLGLLAIPVVWVLFFPVPVGWAIRLGAGRALKDDPATKLALQSATFRWRIGQPAVNLDARGLVVTSGGRPLVALDSATVVLSKSGLWSRHFAPDTIQLKNLVVTIDQPVGGPLATPKPGGGGTAGPPNRPTGSAAAPLDLTPFEPGLPSRGKSSQVVIDGFVLRLRTGSSEAALPFGRIETTLNRSDAGDLRLDLGVPLTTAPVPPRLQARIALPSGSSKVSLSVSLPEFNTADLPAVPGTPPLPLRGKVALDLDASFDVSTGALGESTANLKISEAEVTVPGLAVKLPLELLELRARSDLSAQRATIEAGRLRAAGIQLDITRLDATLGDKPQVTWDIVLSGIEAARLLPYLPGELRDRIPLPDPAVATISVPRVASVGTAAAVRDPAGSWTTTAVDLSSSVRIQLGQSPMQFDLSARQSAGGPIAVSVRVPEFRPSALPAALTGGTPADAVDLPIGIQLDATLTPAGVPRSAAVAVTGGAGTIRPLAAGLPTLQLRGFRVRADSERPLESWRIPLIELTLTDGASATLADAEVAFDPKRIAVKGKLSAQAIPASLASGMMAPDALKQLADLDLALSDLTLSSFATDFDAALATDAAGQWTSQSGKSAGTVRVRVKQSDIAVKWDAALPRADGPIDAAISTEPFYPGRFGLKIPAYDLAGLDFPVTASARVTATLAKGLSTASISATAGPGRVRLPAPVDASWPLQAFALEADYDHVTQRAAIRSARVQTDLFAITIPEATANLAKVPYPIAGKAEIAAFSLKQALALWPEKLEPDLRRLALDSLRGGNFTGGKFDVAVELDPANPSAMKIGRGRGELGLAALDATIAGTPGPLTAGAIRATVDYPAVVLTATEIGVPGARIPSVEIAVPKLDDPTALVTARGRFEADVPAAIRAWKLPVTTPVEGAASGEFTVRLPQDVSTVDADVAIDLARARAPIPGLPNAAPRSVHLVARATGLASDKGGTVEFSVDAPGWIGADLGARGSAVLTSERTPSAIDLSEISHGRTRLSAKVLMPNPAEISVAVAGRYFDAAPFMRTGLVVAEAMAPAPAGPAAGKPAPAPVVPAARAPVAPTAARGAAPARGPASAPPAPGRQPLPAPAPAVVVTAARVPPRLTVTVDAKIDEIDFGGRSAANFNVQAKLEDNWPVALAMRADSAARPGAGSGAVNVLRVDLNGPIDSQTLKLEIGDAASWVGAFTSPWTPATAGNGPYGAMIVEALKVPVMLAGGAVTAEAELRRSEKEWFRGSLKIARATMIQPPRVLQLLALKSGKSLQKSPLIEQFAIGKITVNDDQVRVEDIVLVGSGLINNLKMRSVDYNLATDALKVDGDYFGVGFDVIGTKADPQVFLKDSNTILRAIGTRNEFDFDTPPAAAATSPAVSGKR